MCFCFDLAQLKPQATTLHWRKGIHKNLNIFQVRSQFRILNSRRVWISLTRWYEFNSQNLKKSRSIKLVKIFYQLLIYIHNYIQGVWTHFDIVLWRPRRPTKNNFYVIMKVSQYIRMQHWRHPATDGAEFWISCKRPAFLGSFSRLQVIQYKRPWCSAAAYVKVG